MMLAVLLGYVLLAIFQMADTQKRAPELDFRHGWWVLAWFVGILIVSYLGSYSGATSADAGQANVYSFNGGVVANIILTAIILALAYYCQLPGHRVEEILNETAHEEPMEPPVAP
jgi:ABC-type amino acid transport system permease subunit